ncbi:DUF4010 domain-containing protein [Ferrovum sp. PN-J185]|uniref:MgtC/SapB family protein n=1 Tax=Ferrovum sp. PN-J185 TaxID=1356306 RepID=UPI00079C0157|nr:DUF4010 domain-containing protein [Ferrovum sp. PN-J185]KXW56809.1 hypothetical protein FV185_07700 [Ferrovum sp. PN-J185]MCC6067698.1 DUF4010 domain-containing protein [Ferrovum sp. PN-J185]MDE1891376.1 DUF4010 domain-containing protein [Betaproteobacteria bacterium]MDE2056098.1 DUF4010 domain-containing protein [Betaproteobacteria bacterium]
MLDLFFSQITNQLWFKFVFTLFFAFLVGLETRGFWLNKSSHIKMGSTRTYTLLSSLGFILYSLDHSYKLFILGMIFINSVVFLFYKQKLEFHQFGILQLIIPMLVYTFGPLSINTPLWFFILVFVTIIFTIGAKPVSIQILKKMDQDELILFSKFLLLSAVILPLLPKNTISTYLPSSPFHIWMAVVVISSISYLGYLLRRYFLLGSGTFITGLLGGVYSSTAATVVLARQSKQFSSSNSAIQAAIVAATSMMYLRLMVLVGILSANLLKILAIPLIVFFIVTLLIAFFLNKNNEPSVNSENEKDKNPLEFATAIVFAGLFILMLFLTEVITEKFGALGLKILAFATGFTDIDPFILSLLNGAYPNLSEHLISGAFLIAAGSNGLLKAIYAGIIGDWKKNRVSIAVLLISGLLSIIWGAILE